MKRAKKTNSGKLAVLISESSVFTDKQGQLISKGGGEGSFHKLAVALASLGLKVKVIAIREFPEQKKHEFIDGIEYVRCSVKSKTSPKILSYLKLAIAEARGADYVFVNQFTPHLILPFINKKCKKIAVIHDVYKEKGVKFWISQFGLIAGIIGSVVEKLQLKFDKKYADEILTVSEESKKKILSAFGGRRKKFEKKIHVVTWPVGGGKSKSKPLQLKDKKDFILFVGRFVDYKNPSHVLHVLKAIKAVWPHFKAVFVASRIDKKVMNEFTDLRYKLGLTLKDVVVEENISYEKLQNYYKEAKLLVHPSFVEGQGMVLAEALAQKTPVVAYDLEAYGAFKAKGLMKILKSKGQKGVNVACIKILGNYKKYFEETTLPESTEKKRFIEVVKKLISE